MARTLTIERSKVSRHERDSYFTRLRERRDRLRSGACNFWVFEDTSEPGVFVEFTEARDADTLVAGSLAAIGGPPTAPILKEVELS